MTLLISHRSPNSPRDGEGYWPFTKLCLTWVHGWEMKGSILHYQSLGPAGLPKEAFHLGRQRLAHGNWELRKRGCSFNCKRFLRADVLKPQENSLLQCHNSCARTLNGQQAFPLINLPFFPLKDLWGYSWCFCLCPILFWSISLGVMPHTWDKPSAAGMNCYLF